MSARTGSNATRALVALGLVVATLPALVLAQETPPAPPTAPTGPHPKWDKETLALFAELPIQDLGRIKPLDTFAGFKLLKFAGRRSCAGPDGTTLSPIAWLLDCLFFPEQAETYPCFVVQNAEVLDRMGLAHENKGKRDRYAYFELAPGLQALHKLAVELEQLADDEGGRVIPKHPEKDRDAVEQQVVLLNHNLLEFEQLVHALDVTRVELPVQSSGGLRTIFKNPQPGFAEIMKSLPLLATLTRELQKADNVAPDVKKSELDAVGSVWQKIDQTLAVLRELPGLALLPPTATPEQKPQWFMPVHIYNALEVRLTKGTQPDSPLDAQIALLGTLDAMSRTRHDPVAFKNNLRSFHDGVARLADARGEYRKIPLEVFFYKGDFFFNALLAFVFSFVFAAFSWLNFDSHGTSSLVATLPAAVRKPVDFVLEKLGLHGISIGLTALGGLLVVIGIVLRCIIRSRPPVSTLYETILFISGVAVISCLVIEGINRQRIASSVAAFLGMAGMFLANKYEFKEAMSAGDTMISLQAVLDTNFWLATHVTSVTMGYSAGLLASAIAHVWLIGQMLGVRQGDTKFYKNITRMVYGVLCFGLLFSTVGTILGGIWANYSWGRFWGWDPKENGALMIVLWELMIFHARMGGYIRDYGLAVLAILGGCVIAFSWWGVNLLGVGLHSYGFTSGIFQILMAVYVTEALLVVLSVIWYHADTFRQGLLWLAGVGKTPGGPSNGSPGSLALAAPGSDALKSGPAPAPPGPTPTGTTGSTATSAPSTAPVEWPSAPASPTSPSPETPPAAGASPSAPPA